MAACNAAEPLRRTALTQFETACGVTPNTAATATWVCPARTAATAR